METKQEEIEKKSWYGKNLQECSTEEQNDVVEIMAKMYEEKRMTSTQTVILIRAATKIIDTDRIMDIVIGVYEKYKHHKKLHRNFKGY